MFSVSEIIKATQGQLCQGTGKGQVRAVSIDSRRVKKGELFIAVKGEIFDGHDFVADVIARGVRVIVVHQAVKVDNDKVDVIRVKDTTRALGDVARFHRLRFKAPVIALTGSAGKTTTKEMMAAVLGRKYRVLKNEGTQNNHIGVPLTLLKLTSKHQIVVLECGTNQPGDIPWLADVARPDVAVFTNIGESHLERLRTPAGVLKEKWALTKFMPRGGRVIINGDDRFLAKQQAGRSLKIMAYGIEAKAFLRADKIALSGGRSLSFDVAGKTVELNSCGINNIYNALAAYAVGLLFAVPQADIVKALKEFEFPAGRGQILRLGRGWLINDAYNANPVSMRSALQTLAALGVEGKKIVVVADMLELGLKAGALHQAVGVQAARSSVDVLITVGKLARYIAVGARAENKAMKIFACREADEAQGHLARVFSNGDAVLVKGSRRMKMEQVVEFLLASPKSSLT